MAVVELHRTRERNDLPDGMRIRLLEADADVFEFNQAENTKILSGIKARTTGVLVALVVASLMLAANLAVGFK